MASENNVLWLIGVVAAAIFNSIGLAFITQYVRGHTERRKQDEARESVAVSGANMAVTTIQSVLKAVTIEHEQELARLRGQIEALQADNQQLRARLREVETGYTK